MRSSSLPRSNTHLIFISNMTRQCRYKILVMPYDLLSLKEQTHMPNFATRTFDEIQVGDLASFSTSITPELVDSFGALSGDTNPLHMDTTYASSSPLGARIPHGM